MPYYQVEFRGRHYAPNEWYSGARGYQFKTQEQACARAHSLVDAGFAQLRVLNPSRKCVYQTPDIGFFTHEEALYELQMGVAMEIVDNDGYDRTRAWWKDSDGKLWVRWGAIAPGWRASSSHAEEAFKALERWQTPEKIRWIKTDPPVIHTESALPQDPGNEPR